MAGAGVDCRRSFASLNFLIRSAISLIFSFAASLRHLASLASLRLDNLAASTLRKGMGWVAVVSRAAG